MLKFSSHEQTPAARSRIDTPDLRGFHDRAPGRSTSSAVFLDDSANQSFDPNHSQDCELQEIHGGRMDHFITGMTFVEGVIQAVEASRFAATRSC